jgi:hypothetical protein
VDRITLLYSTGAEQIDVTLRQIIAAGEAAFPGRIGIFLLIGSYHDGNPIATSDLDLVAVFRDDFAPGEEARAHKFAEALALGSAVPVDLDVIAADTLLAGHAPLEAVRLRFGCVPVSGTDLRDRLPLPPLSVYRRLVTPAPYVNFVGIIRGRTAITYPLDYPDPAGAFYGYDALRLSNRYSPDGRGLKDLVAGVTWAATALLALRAGRYVVGKAEAMRQYQAAIGDEWSDIIAEIYALCRLRWAYLVPTDPAERWRLRHLCQRVLAFENHYFAVYRDYLLAELRGADPAGRLFAARRCGEVLYPDEAIAAALAVCAADPAPNVAGAARSTLATRHAAGL